jgi:hypothetical protein
MDMRNAMIASARSTPNSSVARNVGDTNRADGVPSRYVPPQ